MNEDVKTENPASAPPHDGGTTKDNVIELTGVEEYKQQLAQASEALRKMRADAEALAGTLEQLNESVKKLQNNMIADRNKVKELCNTLNDKAIQALHNDSTLACPIVDRAIKMDKFIFGLSSGFSDELQQ